MIFKVLTEDELTDRIAILVGTRPGIIKCSPIIRAMIEKRMDPIIIHAGQHYSYELDKIFFEELELPSPTHHVHDMEKIFYHGEQTAHMLTQIEKVLLKEKPRAIIVAGDANTNLAGALAARKLRINLVHLEAGLRSNDWRMPEEHNRVIIDHISDILLVPTIESLKNLTADGVKGKIFVVGNTISDAVTLNRLEANKKSVILNTLELIPKKYFLVTMHREENVDDEKILYSLSNLLRDIAKEFSMDIVFPLHPRTNSRLRALKISLEDSRLKLIKPVGYFDFLSLLDNCAVVLTDSGGIQEEACILGVPCITLRDNTERPETVNAGANAVVGHDKEKTFLEIRRFLANRITWTSPYGRDVGKKIANLMEAEFLTH